MDCPKCGAAQENEREDCVSCGIIFERWQRAQEQAILARGTDRFAPPPPPPDEPGLPRWLVFVVVAIVITFGMMWTIRRREARAKVDLAAEGKARINEINRQGIAARQRMQDEMDRAQRLRNDIEADAAPEGNPGQLAANTIGETVARDLIQRCPELYERGIIRLPKSYDLSAASFVFEQYPELHAAQRSELLRVDRSGDRVTHTIGITGGIRISDAGSVFEVDLGPRQIVGFSSLRGDADHAEGSFTWNWEDRAAAEIFYGRRLPVGSATFLHQNGVWQLKRASIQTKKEGTLSLCRGMTP